MTDKSMKLTRRSKPTLPMRRDDHRGLGMALLGFGIAFLLLFIAILLNQPDNPFLYSYFIPWIIVVFVVVCIPIVALIMFGSFNLFHPLVYAAWSYFIPAFVLGPLYLATGGYDPWYMPLISKPEYYFPMTFIYIALGFTGLTLGFLIPLGRRVGGKVSRSLPAWDWKTSDLLRPAIILVIIGELFKLAAYANSHFGYQHSENISTFGATQYMFGLLSAMGSFLLWFAIFRTKRLMLRHYLIVTLLLVLMVYSMMLGGGKGVLFSNMMLVIAAFVFSGRRIRMRQAMLIGLLILGTLLVGMVYGTIFRQIKGNEASIDLQENFTLGVETFDKLGNQGLIENLTSSMEALFQRIETVSQLAVYVANYRTLQPMEASYGIADIWTMTWTAFIPRAIWPDKPNISGARALGLLYFNNGNTSPAVSPMIDLLRNYGPMGVPLGMALLGVFLRTIYVALIQRPLPSAVHIVGYYMLLTSVNYESMFGSLLPVLIRVCVVYLIGIMILSALMPRRRRVNVLGT